jgi:DNA-directed RNA polymerase specialized sigma24 family protein
MQQERREAEESGPVSPAEGAGVPATFEEAYLHFAPLLRKIAVKKFGIPIAEAEPLVHDVFATYFTNADEVHDIGPYLVGGICNAARHYLRRVDARTAIFCEDLPCAGTPGDALQLEVERKLLLRRLFARIGSRCRDLLHRYYLAGEDTKTIAGALHFKPMTVLICLSKCRKRALEAYNAMTERPQP